MHWASSCLLYTSSLPTKVRQVTDKEGREQFLLYVKQADRDYARYCTGWRPGGDVYKRQVVG